MVVVVFFLLFFLNKANVALKWCTVSDVLLSDIKQETKTDLLPKFFLTKKLEKK